MSVYAGRRGYLPRRARSSSCKIWGERIRAPVIASSEGGDAAGIVYDERQAGHRRPVSTRSSWTPPGRLQNKTHLMDELFKVPPSCSARLNPDAPHDIILVLDATTGQNGLNQIEVFRDLAGVTGLVDDQARWHGPRRRAGRGGREIRPADPRHRGRRRSG